MGTKDLTHEAIARALTNGDLLTHAQRSVLLGLVADDKAWQRECDRLRANAGRFQWLAEHTAATGLARWVHPFQFLDEAVDERRTAGATRPD